MGTSYTVQADVFQNPVAICRNAIDYKQAIADKQKNPSLSFNKVQWVLQSGTKFAQLMWQNGRWC